MARKSPRRASVQALTALLLFQFILEGIPAILCGALVWFCLPDFPETAKFLTVEERAFAVARLGDSAPKGTDKHFDKTEAINCLKSWQFWVFAVHYFCM